MYIYKYKEKILDPFHNYPKHPTRKNKNYQCFWYKDKDKKWLKKLLNKKTRKQEFGEHCNYKKINELQWTLY